MGRKICLDSITKLYNLRSEIYEGTWHAELGKDFARRAALNPGAAVLDLACGTGIVSRHAKRIVVDGQVIGVDISPGMLAKAIRAADVARLDIIYVLGDITKLHELKQLQLAKFDLITCCSAFTLLPDPAESLKHWVPYLKKGGKLMIDIPAPDTEGGFFGLTTLTKLSKENLLQWNFDDSNAWIGAVDRFVNAYEDGGLKAEVWKSDSYDERKNDVSKADIWFDNLVGQSFYGICFKDEATKNRARDRFVEIVQARAGGNQFLKESIHVTIAVGIKI